MNLREEIFKELRRLNFRENRIWIFNQYNSLYGRLHFSPDKFNAELLKLCDEGFFLIEKRGNDPVMYKLTAKGANILWAE